MSVEFEPVRVRRRRRLDPLALASVAVLVGLAAALVKPWDGAEDAPTGLAPPSIPPGDLGGPPAAAIVAIPRVVRAGVASGLTWSRLEPAVRRHDGWGIRAIVAEPGTVRPLAERWLAAAPGDADIAPSAQLDPGDGSILALGLTFPPSQTPLDARFWQVTESGLDWLDARPVDGVPSGGGFLYLRPGGGTGAPLPWTGGTYRIDVLVNGSIRRLTLTIPDRFSNVPPPVVRPSLREQGPLVPPTLSLLTELPVGAFATSDGVAIPLDGDGGPALDEAGAWLNLDPGTGRTARSWVATAYLPRATGLGVMLPERSVVLSASVVRLAPEPLPEEPARVDPRGADLTASSYALFRAPGGTAWSPGVYRLTARWTDTDGLHEGSWHVELRPSRAGPTASLLAAARAWAPSSGTTGVLLAATGDLEVPAAAGGIRPAGLRPTGSMYPAESGVGCGGTVIDEAPAILGFTFPADRLALRVGARIERPFLRRDDQVMLSAGTGVLGLALAAPGRMATLPGADYVFTVVTAGGIPLDYSLCLDMATFDDS